MIFAAPPPVQTVTATCAVAPTGSIFVTLDKATGRMIVDSRESTTATPRVLAQVDAVGGSVEPSGCRPVAARLKTDYTMTPFFPVQRGFSVNCFGGPDLRLVIRLAHLKGGGTRLTLGLRGSTALVATLTRKRVQVAYAGALCYRWHQ